MEDVIPAGDVDVGDVIVLPDADGPVVVSRVRLGQGGLIFTVTSASNPGRVRAEVFDLEHGLQFVSMASVEGSEESPHRRKKLAGAARRAVRHTAVS